MATPAEILAMRVARVNDRLYPEYEVGLVRVRADKKTVGHLREMAILIPDVVKMVEHPWRRSNFIMYLATDKTAHPKGPCGREYYASTHTKIKPDCEECEAWMDKQVAQDPGLWGRLDDDSEE